jgi:hypothetical protein
MLDNKNGSAVYYNIPSQHLHKLQIILFDKLLGSIITDGTVVQFQKKSMFIMQLYW